MTDHTPEEQERINRLQDRSMGDLPTYKLGDLEDVPNNVVKHLRIKQEHAELVEALGKLLKQIQVMGFIIGGPISEAEIEAHELLEKVK